MISAMPAVALRRERKKEKTISSHDSIASLSRGRGFAKRSRTQSISTISSLAENHLDVRYRKSRANVFKMDEQKLRLLIYLGTVLLVAGLVLVFLGVGAGVSTAQTIGLVFIGFGALLCFVKVFVSEQQATLIKRPKIASVSKDSLYTMTATSTNTTSPGDQSTDFASLPIQRSPMSPAEESGATTQSDHSRSLTPTRLNSIPETQVLLVDEEKSDKF
ncbi:uncharacterized protein LOC106459629 [Limulus polyphemus]|uniref:Uncharacterized protein LOC106459629 n=1 Tax=Limulus polyphemus TaxID=6850 RepID=A0ABM1SEM5_LIMPO|nr:uncharacterized protein LOC106459629 [Limulus polyphemus]XP_022242087.1 uncharacterized protein LOC106459629 [Limulus polyphemus]